MAKADRGRLAAFHPVCSLGLRYKHLRLERKVSEKITGKSEDRAKLNFEQLLAFVADKFPSCVIEKQVAEKSEDTGATEIHYKRAINWQALGTLVGEELSSGQGTVGRELFGFAWSGKNEAAREANRVIDMTLRPCPAESLDWDNTGNLYIEGDNLQALKMLQGSYLGKVKMIYIDPPYNTGSEFVYNDDFRQNQEDYVKESGEIDEVSGARLVSKAFTLNADTSPRYHSKWCSMMYSRLLLARDLLRRDGVIFISIDDHEQHHLRDICDEIFGERNFVAQFVWKKKQGGANDSGAVVIDHEYILLYAKDLDSADLGLDYEATPDSEGYPFEDDKGRYNLITLDKSSIRKSASLIFEIEGPNGEIYRPRVVKGVQSCWRWSKEKVLQDYDQLVFKEGKVYTKNYMKAGVKPRSLLIEANRFGRTNHGKKDLQHLFETCPFSYPKPVALVKYLLSLINGRDFTVLDFFSGSATTAEAVISANAKDGGNRRFILVQLPEECTESTSDAQGGYRNICEIGKERIRRVAKSIASQLKCTKIVHGGGYESFRHI